MQAGGGDDELPDPIVTAAVMKAVGSAAEDVSKSKLLERVLGPAADELGDALKRYTAYRTRNVGRIVEAANKKSKNGTEEHHVHPRVAHRLLEEGSYCDDELMAEYLGGLLAGSRTPNGRDDRAVAWTELVTTLSALQIRAHYLLYRTWAEQLVGRDDVPLNIEIGRQQAIMDVDLDEFAAELIKGREEIDVNVALAHTIPGLARMGLLDDVYQFGSREALANDSIFDAVLRVKLSVAGIELFGWAMGEPDITGESFTRIATANHDSSLPDPLARVSTPQLPPLRNAVQAAGDTVSAEAPPPATDDGAENSEVVRPASGVPEIPAGG